MAEEVGSLAVRLGLDGAELRSGLQKATRNVKSFSGSSTKNFRKVSSSVVAMTAVVKTASVAMTAAFVVSGGKQAKAISVLSQVSKSTTEEFQKLTFAAKNYNIEQEKLGDILKDVNDRIGDFVHTGGGPMADFFEKIGPKVGVTAEHFRNLSGPQALQLYISSLEKANLSQEDMTFFLEAMSSDLTNLLPLFRENGKLLKEQSDRAEELGIVLSDIDIFKLEKMNESLETASSVSKAAGNIIKAELSPYVEEAARSFTELATEGGGFGPKVVSAVEMAAKAVGVMRNGIHGIQVVAKGLETGFHGFGVAVATVLAGASSMVDSFIDGTKSAINVLIRALNHLPKVDISELIVGEDSSITQFLENNLKTVKSSFEESKRELHEMAMEPLPSTAVDEYLERVRERAQQVAEEFAETRKEMLAPEGEQTEEEKQAEAEGRLEEHLKRMFGIERKHQSAIQKLVGKRWGYATSETAGAMKSIVNTMATGSRKAFEVSKAWAIADTVISTAQSIAASSRLGWPMAIPAVAWSAATGLAQLNQIKNQSFGGGGGAAASGQGAPAQAPNPIDVGGRTGGGGSGTLTVAPIDPNAIFSGSAMQSFGEQIHEFSKDGGKVVFAA